MNYTNNLPSPSARLGANHGYQIHGDVARLHAEVEGLDSPALLEDWALQLWACDLPHHGGPLSGIKVAEMSLSAHTGADAPSLRVEREADARVPGGERDYAMVLVLARGVDGQYNQVYDFANYPARQRFITPHLEGCVGYRIDADHLVLEAERVRSPRSEDNISGSLVLDLWAVASPYRGGSVDGVLLGRAPLGQLVGQSVLGPVAVSVPFTDPRPGRWEVVMMLREWTRAAGYVTRDYVRFPTLYVTVREDVPASVHVTDIVRVPMKGESLREDASVSSPAIQVAAEVAASGVSINQATVEQLASVKGMNKKLAAEIVAQRPHASLDALLDVRGMGPKLLAKLRSQLSL